MEALVRILSSYTWKQKAGSIEGIPSGSRQAWKLRKRLRVTPPEAASH